MPEAKTGPVPELRFPEFRNAGPWEVKRLGEIATTVKKRNSARQENRVLTNSAEFGVVDQRSFFNKDIAVKENLEGYTIVEENDFVYNPRISATAPVGPISRNKVSRGVMSPLYTVFRFENGSLDFLDYFFQSSAWHPYLIMVGSTGARHDRLSVSIGDFLDMPILFPSQSEQQKIADCLTSLDDLIRAESERVEALKRHKRGLMQQLFPAPGETTPRLRFPEFRDAGPWQVKRLGEIAEINPSTGPLPPSFVYIDLESVEGGELVQKKRISRKDAPSRAQRVLRVGDVIYQMVRPYQMNNLFFDIDDGQEYVASTGYAQLRAKGSNRFLCQLIHTTPFTKLVLEKCTGSNYPAISSSDIADVRATVPPLPEQQKIADCLGALDDLIRSQSERVEALKRHKRGLMQKLFPREIAQ